MLFNLRTLLLLSLVATSAQGLEDEDDDAELAFFARKADSLLDRFEDSLELTETAMDHVFDRASTLADKAAPFAQMLIGTSLALHGGELETTLLFAQALRQVGGPQLNAALKDLSERWRAVSAAIRQETPTLQTMREALHKCADEARDLRKAVRVAVDDYGDDGSVKIGDAIRYKKDIQREFQELRKAANRARAASEPFAKLVEALDPESVVRVVDGAWQTVLVCVSTATNAKAANVGIGLGLGEDFEDNVVSSLTEYLDVPLFGKFANAALSAVSRLGTIAAAFQYEDLALAVAGSSLGAKLLVDGLSRTNTFLGRKLARGNTTDLGQPGPKNLVRAAAHVAVTAAGVGIQLAFRANNARLVSLGRAPIPPFSPFRVVLAPAFRFDRRLKSLSPAVTRKAPVPLHT